MYKGKDFRLQEWMLAPNTSLEGSSNSSRERSRQIHEENYDGNPWLTTPKGDTMVNRSFCTY